MVLNKFGLTDIVLTRRDRSDFGEQSSLSKGVVRAAFERVYAPEREYVLFQVVANPVAVTELGRYMASRKESETDFEEPWVIQKIGEGDHPVYVPGARDGNNGLKYDHSLFNRYLETVCSFADARGLRGLYSHYSLVETFGLHDLDRDSNSIFWPHTFMVAESAYKPIRSIIDTLTGDVALDYLYTEESPQFYSMAEIQVLHDTGIAPLLVLDREIRVTASELSMYVDFLCQMSVSKRGLSFPFEDD